MTTPATAGADPIRQVDDNADDWWHGCAMTALRTLAQNGQEFTAYDLTELGVPDPDHANRWGGLFAGAREAKLIRAVGYAPSRRPGARGSAARVWRGVRDNGA